MENYTLSDIAAATGDGFGNGNNGWIMIMLFALIFGGGGFRNYGNHGGGYGDFATAASQQEILFGQRFAELDNKIDRIGNGIADATFALNNSVTNEGRAVLGKLADCCCENLRASDAIKFDMANYAAALGRQSIARARQQELCCSRIKSRLCRDRLVSSNCRMPCAVS